MPKDHKCIGKNCGICSLENIRLTQELNRMIKELLNRPKRRLATKTDGFGRYWLEWEEIKE